MTNHTTILVLGGTGKTGRRIAPRLRAAGADVRTAARRGADVSFDWYDTTTHDAALDGIRAVYLVPPAQELDYAALVSEFLDRAQKAGVRHVTQLSARGVDLAPPTVPPRATELDLASRDGLTHSVLRPGWFMQNFSEAFFVPVDGVISAPAGAGAEAFVHADDIAEVAVATLLDPAAHDGKGYTLTGPEALTFAQVAHRIAAATGQDVEYRDESRADWVARQVSAGMREDYAQLLGGLLDEGVRSSRGSAVSFDVELVTGHRPRDFDSVPR